MTSCPEKFWRSISPASKECDVFNVGGILTHNNARIANAFNDHFKSVFSCDNSVLPIFETVSPRMPDIVVSEQGILNMLVNLNIRKSSGPDNIPNAFLKRYAEWMSKYLHVLFTKSLREGQVPDDWKTARVKPIHKSGNKQSVKNYRPVSLTSTVCKLLEHIIHNSISYFLDEHNILNQHQHGFRKGFSTTTQLVSTIHDFATSINNGKQTDAIFMDFAKAFDKVSHNKLVYNLEKILGNGQLIKWISAYLKNREQFVVFNNHSSHRVSVDSGVPQGSVLGPLLFILYINDIVNGIPVNIRLYADDCVIYSEIESLKDQVLLNKSFNKVVSWCEAWQMSINFEKKNSVHVHFS